MRAARGCCGWRTMACCKAHVACGLGWRTMACCKTGESSLSHASAYSAAHSAAILAMSACGRPSATAFS